MADPKVIGWSSVSGMKATSVAAPVIHEQSPQYFFVDCGLSYYGGAFVTITNAQQIDPVVITYTGTDPTNGSKIRIWNITGMTELNGNVYTVANVNTITKTFQLSGTAGSAFTPYVSGGVWEYVLNSVSGLDHLEGQTVDICGDDEGLAPQVVTGGALTLPGYYNRIAVGLHYDYLLEPQSLEVNIQTGTSVGIQKRIEKVTLRLYNTVGCKVGPTIEKAKSPIGFPDGLFTGDVPIEFEGDYDSNAFISVVSDSPLPCTVLGILPILEAYER